MGTTRQLIFAINPYGDDEYMTTISFAQVPDANLTSKAFTCGLVQNGSTSGATLMQETVWLGTTDAVGKTFQAFDSSLAEDDGETVTAMAVTQRLDPDARADSKNPRFVSQKRYLTLNAHGKPLKRSGVTVQACVDGDPLSGDSLTWVDLQGDNDDQLLYFEGARGNFIHLKIVDSSNTHSEVAIPAFSIAYNPDGPEREGRT